MGPHRPGRLDDARGAPARERQPTERAQETARPAGGPGGATGQDLAVVVLSDYVAGPYLRDLLDGAGEAAAAGAGGVGYLLKERVGRVADFPHSLELVASGGVVVDPEVLDRLVRTGEDTTGAPGAVTSSRSGRTGAGEAPEPGAPPTPSRGRGLAGNAEDPDERRLARLTRREEEVLALMAEGLSNAQVAERLVLSDGAVAKHVANVLAKLDLPPGEDNRRVRAVLTFLRARA